MIEIRDVHKAHAGRPILAGASLHVARGETVCLVGPSGGGKSTLLRLLIGLDQADAGMVRVGEHEIAAASPPAERRKRLAAIRGMCGLVFQDCRLFAHRTVLGNVIEAPVHVRGLSPVEATTRAHGLLAEVGLDHRADAWPRELSGGEQQRAAIARALALDPDVLLLDEPTSALDPERVDDLLAILRRLSTRGLTLLAVTHDERFATALASRVVALRGGRITA